MARLALSTLRKVLSSVGPAHKPDVEGIPTHSPHDIMAPETLNQRLDDMWGAYKESKDPDLLAVITRWSKHIGVSFKTLDARLARKKLAESLPKPFRAIVQRREGQAEDCFSETSPFKTWKERILAVHPNAVFSEVEDFIVAYPAGDTHDDPHTQLGWFDIPTEHGEGPDSTSDHAPSMPHDAQRKSDRILTTEEIAQLPGGADKLGLEKGVTYCGRDNGKSVKVWWDEDAWEVADTPQHDDVGDHEFRGAQLDEISCSQCGCTFGPGTTGFSDCRQHQNRHLKIGDPVETPQGDVGTIEAMNGDTISVHLQDLNTSKPFERGELRAAQRSLPYHQLSPQYRRDIDKRIQQFLAQRGNGPLQQTEIPRLVQLTGLDAREVGQVFEAVRTRGAEHANMVLAVKKLFRGAQAQPSPKKVWTFKAVQTGPTWEVVSYCDGEEDSVRHADDEQDARNQVTRLEAAHQRHAQSSAMNPPAQAAYSNTATSTSLSAAGTNPSTMTQLPPKPTTPPPFGKQYVFDPASNSWKVVPVNQAMPAA